MATVTSQERIGTHAQVTAESGQCRPTEMKSGSSNRIDDLLRQSKQHRFVVI